MSKIRKLMAILLVVLFLATVTIGAISAKPECTKCTKTVAPIPVSSGRAPLTVPFTYKSTGSPTRISRDLCE
jgi:PKD repeat protein